MGTASRICERLFSLGFFSFIKASQANFGFILPNRSGIFRFMSFFIRIGAVFMAYRVGDCRCVARMFLMRVLQKWVVYLVCRKRI
jgi:hypothetical protein